jgi:hypothetical protein
MLKLKKSLVLGLDFLNGLTKSTIKDIKIK